MSWLWAARRTFETMDTSHRLRRALLAGVRASAHSQGIVNCELVLCLAEASEKTRLTPRTALVTHQCYCPAIVVGKEKHKFVSYRGRVTKVAPECLREASVAEQMSWHITTKEKTLFEHALDEGEHFVVRALAR